MKKITNQQKQQLKMLFGKDTNLKLTFDQAEEKIKDKQEKLEAFRRNNFPLNLDGGGLFDRWIEDAAFGRKRNR
jgi:hypothetical protein